LDQEPLLKQDVKRFNAKDPASAGSGSGEASFAKFKKTPMRWL